MAEIRGGAAILRGTQLDFQREYRRAVRRAARRITQAVVDAAGEDGLIPFEARNAPRRAVSQAVASLFTDQAGRAFGADGITPLAPYPRLLNRALADGQYRSIILQWRYMRRWLPEELLRYLSEAPLPRPRRETPAGESAEPLALADPRQEDLIQRYRGIFWRSDDLGYDPAHRFVDPRGYRLSDRIWRASRAARETIDGILTRSIAEGIGAARTAKRLERSLLPSRANVRATGRRVILPRRPGEEPRTQRLYWWGKNASYDAMRLARTEITASIGRAQLAAARANPFVDAMTWRLSPNHPRPDICDDYADRAYPLNDTPPYPAHPHCLCRLAPTSSRPRREAVRDIQEAHRRYTEEGDGRYRPVMNTASGPAFAAFLLGPLLHYVSTRFLAGGVIGV